MASRLETRIAGDRRSISGVLRLRKLAGIDDEDPHDIYGEHLVVTCAETGTVVGACRLLSPGGARLAGAYRAEREFDIAQLDVLRGRMVEVARACVHPDYPQSTVLALLWAGVARYLVENNFDYVVGTASVDADDGGHGAAAIYRDVCAAALSPDDYRVFPRRRLPWEVLGLAGAATPPPLLRGYLALGAWVCGEPAVDAARRVAALPMLLPLSRMRGRHARHFLARAA